jgi:hypothetical protein
MNTEYVLNGLTRAINHAPKPKRITVEVYNSDDMTGFVKYNFFSSEMLSSSANMSVTVNHWVDGTYALYVNYNFPASPRHFTLENATQADEVCKVLKEIYLNQGN